MKLGSIASTGYSHLQEMEDAHGRAEQVRLAYVAMTRARDHLFVSMYRSTTRGNRQSKGVTSRIEEHLLKLSEDYEEASVGAGDSLKLEPDRPYAVEVDDYDPGTWLDERNGIIRERSLPSAVTATQLARTAGAIADAEEIEDKDSDQDEERSIIRGREGPRSVARSTLCCKRLSSCSPNICLLMKVPRWMIYSRTLVIRSTVWRRPMPLPMVLRRAGASWQCLQTMR